MAPNLALFDFDADGGNSGFTADPGDVVSITIRNPNVRNWQAQVWDANAFATGNPILDNPPRKSKNAPDVALVGATTGSIVAPVTPAGAVTLELPNTGNGINSYLVRVVVDGGMTNGVIDPNKVHQREISTAPTNLRKPVVTELGEFEFDSWAGPVCDLIDAYAAIVGGGGSFNSAGSRQAVRVATAASLPAYTRAGNVLTADANGALPSIDGVSLVVGERLLLVDGAGPSSAAHAGIYVVTSLGGAGSPWVLTRATDMDASSEVEPGVHFWVLEGTANGGNLAVLVSPSSGITINTTALDFALFDLSGAGGVLPSATKGDTYVFDGTDVDTVSIGASGQVYGVPYGQGSGGMPSYFTPDFDQIFPGAKAGDLIQWDGSNWVFVTIGAEGQVPVVNGDGEVEFQDPPTGLPTNAQEGDLTIFKSGAWVSLPIGPSGSVVGSVGGYPTYMLIASGSGGGSGSFFPIGAKGTMLRSNGSEWETFGPGKAGQFVGTDGTTPNFVDLPSSSSTNLTLKVRLATTGNVTLSGEQSIDEVAAVAGDRVLVRRQTTASQNGVYVVSAGSWTRATDADSESEFPRGTLVVVSEGSTLHDSLWINATSTTPISFGTTAIEFFRLSLPHVAEEGSTLIVNDDGEFEWLPPGTDDTVLTMQNGEPAWLEPETAGSSTDPFSSIRVVDADCALDINDLPGPHTVTGHEMFFNFNGPFFPSTIDGVFLETGLRVLVFTDPNTSWNGGDQYEGVWEFVDLGSISRPWRMRRVPQLDSSEDLIRNAIVKVGRGTNYGGAIFENRTKARSDANVPFTLESSLIDYQLSTSSPGGPIVIPGGDSSYSEIVTADTVVSVTQLGSVTFNSSTGVLESTANVGLTGDAGSVDAGETFLVPGGIYAGVWLVTQSGQSTGTPRHWQARRVAEMDSAEKFLACKMVQVMTGLGITGSDYYRTTWFNFVDRTQPFTLNVTSGSFAVEWEETSQHTYADLAIDVASVPASTPTGVDFLQANSNGAFPTVDGVAPVAGYLYLFFGTSTLAGVWRLSSVGDATSRWSMFRAVDLTKDGQLTRNRSVVIRKGARGVYSKDTDGQITVGTTPISYSLATGGGTSTGGSLLQARVATTESDLPSNTRTGSNRVATVNAVLTSVGGAPAFVGMEVLIFGLGVGVGLWTVTDVGSGATPWRMTRSARMDTSTEVDNNFAVAVSDGTYEGKLFVRIASVTNVTLNTTTLQWEQATSDNEIDPALLDGVPAVWSTAQNKYVPFHSATASQSEVVLTLPNIRSSAARRGLWMRAVNDSFPARILLERGRLNSGETTGEIGEIVASTFLSGTPSADYTETHRLRAISGVPASGIPGLASYPRVGYWVVNGSGWTTDQHQTIVRGAMASFFPGLVAVERLETLAPTVGDEWSFGFKQNAAIIARLYAAARQVSGTSVTTSTIGLSARYGGNNFTAGKYDYHELTTTSATTGTFGFSIPLAAGEIAEIDYTITGWRSDGAAVASKSGRYLAYRLASGSIAEGAHDFYEIFRSPSASTWGGDDVTKPVLNTGQNRVDFQAVGVASTTILWSLEVGYTIRKRNGAAGLE